MNKLLLAALVTGALSTSVFAADYTIMAPAGPGGGWDQTARTMQDALQTEGISGNVQVTNVPGAGGTIGLAQFATQENGNPNALIVGGYVMVGAILSPRSLALPVRPWRSSCPPRRTSKTSMTSSPSSRTIRVPSPGPVALPVASITSLPV